MPASLAEREIYRNHRKSGSSGKSTILKGILPDNLLHRRERKDIVYDSSIEKIRDAKISVRQVAADDLSTHKQEEIWLCFQFLLRIMYMNDAQQIIEQAVFK